MQPRESLTHLSDDELLEQIDRLALGERQATARLIASLAELDARRLYLGLGYTSLFAYCTERLHLSEHAALNRIEAARAARAFPVILERLAEGAVTLTAVRLLRPLLTPDTHMEVLERARHMGKDKVLELIARLRPQPPVPSTIRKLPTPRGTDAGASIQAGTAASSLDFQPSAVAISTPSGRRPVIAPLSEEHYKVQVTFTRAAHDKLRRAQALMRHQLPNGDPAVILERGLDALLTELMKTKAALAEHPRAVKPQMQNPSRHIPADVKRAVWTRDGGQCAFQGGDGRCSETGCLEYHHVLPYAAGGKATIDNIELRCRAHNGYEAERFFGSRMPPLFKESAPAK